MTIFPVLAPLSVNHNASALAFYAFVRSFAQTWGITIASTILQNELSKNLPTSFTSQFPQGVEIAFAAIPVVKELPEPIRSEVREAFAGSMSLIWLVMMGISVLGLFTVALLKEIPMTESTDETYALEARAKKADIESISDKASEESAPL